MGEGRGGDGRVRDTGAPGESASVNGLAGRGGVSEAGCRKDTTILLLGRRVGREGRVGGGRGSAGGE